MSRRSRAREVVLQVLYQDDLNPSGSQVAIGEFVHTRLHHDAALIEFAESLVSGVRRNRQELDGLLSRLAANWSLERMAATDRNVMRLAAYEIMYTETPGAVVINEAVDLARRFGSRQSSQFVNGVLDRLLQERSAK
jgi:transcription antitermination protein NusB